MSIDKRHVSDSLKNASTFSLAKGMSAWPVILIEAEYCHHSMGHQRYEDIVRMLCGGRGYPMKEKRKLFRMERQHDEAHLG